MAGFGSQAGWCARVIKSYADLLLSRAFHFGPLWVFQAVSNKCTIPKTFNYKESIKNFESLDRFEE